MFSKALVLSSFTIKVAIVAIIFFTPKKMFRLLIQFVSCYLFTKIFQFVPRLRLSPMLTYDCHIFDQTEVLIRQFDNRPDIRVEIAG